MDDATAHRRVASARCDWNDWMREGKQRRSTSMSTAAPSDPADGAKLPSSGARPPPTQPCSRKGSGSARKRSERPRKGSGMAREGSERSRKGSRTARKGGAKRKDRQWKGQRKARKGSGRSRKGSGKSKDRQWEGQGKAVKGQGQATGRARTGSGKGKVKAMAKT